VGATRGGVLNFNPVVPGQANCGRALCFFCFVSLRFLYSRRDVFIRSGDYDKCLACAGLAPKTQWFLQEQLILSQTGSCYDHCRPCYHYVLLASYDELCQHHSLLATITNTICDQPMVPKTTTTATMTFTPWPCRLPVPCKPSPSPYPPLTTDTYDTSIIARHTVRAKYNKTPHAFYSRTT